MPGVTKVRALLVDDSEKNLLALEAILAGLDVCPVRANSGVEALRRVLDEDFAVILMDVQMPGMDGFEAADLIRGRDRSRYTPIIFLTAFGSDAEKVSRGYSLGAVDFLAKPIVPEILRSKVAVFVDLFLKTEQVREQAEELSQNHLREHERALTEERQRWEMLRLREDAAREKAIAEAHSQRAEELARTVAERERAERELAAARDELAIQLADTKRLHTLSSRLPTSLELSTVLQEVLESIMDLQGADRGVLMLHDRERQEMVTAASAGFAPDQLASLGASLAGRQDDEGITAVISGDIVVADIGFDPVLAPHLAAARAAGDRGICATPLLTVTGEMIGSIATYFPHPHRPTDREARMVEIYAQQAAQFIENARFHREIREADRHKGEFLAMLAHELRNPLSPLLNAMHLLRGAVTPAAEQARAIAERQVLHLARLVDDLLDVSRIDTGKIELRTSPVVLQDVVGRAVDSSRPLVQSRDHNLSVNLPADPLLLMADPARLEQVLTNLLNNASKYTDLGGNIFLEVERSAGEATIRVRDTGIGITPELLPRVFDLFTQAKRSLDRSQGGLGIGLTLVRHLVELHGGTVSASSEGIGLGSVFTVRLPVSLVMPSDVPSGAIAAPAASGTSRLRRPSRVLVVEDNPDGAQLLARVIRGFNHEATVVNDGPSALEAVQIQQFDLVLLDIGLPGMDGFEVARRIRRGSALPHLIALTGYGQEDDRIRSREAGFDDHLVKPVAPNLLKEILDRENLDYTPNQEV
jgi:signal transduction histidine kinase/DNA-binding response OmpR family regulator